MQTYTFDEILKQQQTALSDAKAKKKQAYSEAFDSRRKQTTSTYEQQIKDAQGAYDDLYRQNAVQRLINERDVAESMANIGLTDSGLNRTQQTAVQLSYANQRGKIDLERRKAVDTLAQQLASSIASIDAQETTTNAEIDEAFDNAAAENATSIYNSQQKNYYDYLIEKAKAEAETAQAKIRAEADAVNNVQNVINADDGILSRTYSGNLADNGVRVVKNDKDGSVTYIDTKTGKRSTFNAGVNPYTDSTNSDLLDENGLYDSTRAFSNGYQPNNISGQTLTAYKRKIGGKSVTMTTTVNGNEQTIWMTPDGTKYVWRGDLNRYVPWAENSVPNTAEVQKKISNDLRGAVGLPPLPINK